jgi:hypothetical protein
MGFRDVLLWPVVRVAGWADDNPLRAAGVVVAVGALGAVVASAGLESGSDSAVTAAYDGTTAGAVVEAALARPAYPVVALVGLVVFALYDG